MPQGLPELVKAGHRYAPLGLTASGALYVGVQVGDRNVKIASVDFNTAKLTTAPPPAAADRFIGSQHVPGLVAVTENTCRYVFARNWMGAEIPSIAIRSLGDRAGVREIPLTLTNSVERRFWSPDGGSFVTQGIDSEGQPRYLLALTRRDGRRFADCLQQVPTEFLLRQPEFGPDGRKVYYLRFQVRPQLTTGMPSSSSTSNPASNEK